MNEKLQKKLIKEFPKLYSNVGASMRWGIECGDGWFKLIYELSKKLSKMEPHIVAEQVKEKFGGGRYYISINNCDCKGAKGDIYELIAKFESDTYKVCEVCGQKGSLDESSWMQTLCSKHKKEKQNRYKKNQTVIQ